MTDLLTRRYALIRQARELARAADREVDQASGGSELALMGAVATRSWMLRFADDLAVGRYDSADLTAAERALTRMREAADAGDLSTVIDAPRTRPQAPAVDLEGSRRVTMTHVRATQTVRGPRDGHMRRLIGVVAR